MKYKKSFAKIAKLSASLFAGFAFFAAQASAQNTPGNIGTEAGAGSNINPNGNISINVGGGGFSVDPGIANSGNTAGSQVLGIVDLIDRIVNAAFIILIGVVFVLFMWNLVQYLRTKEDDYKKAMARDFVILFVSVAVWGLVAVVSNALGIGVGGTGV